LIQEVSDDNLMASLKDKIEEQSDGLFDPAFQGPPLTLDMLKDY